MVNTCKYITTNTFQQLATPYGPLTLQHRLDTSDTNNVIHVNSNSTMANDILRPQDSLPSELRDTGSQAGLSSAPGFSEVLHLAEQIRLQLGTTDYSVDGEMMSSHNLLLWIQHSETLLGEDIVYNDELITSLNLRDITTADCLPNDTALATGTTLDAIIAKNLTPHLLKGQSALELRTTLAHVTNAVQVIDLLQNGQHRFMQEGFVPNGGREVSSGGSYLNMRRICNQSIYDLLQKRQCLVFSYDILVQCDAMKELHVSPLVWTTKAGKVLGRTCLHASKASKSYPSYNESIDYMASRAIYKKPILPLLPDLAEMACQQRDKYPGQVLAGATVDVSTAYNQFAMTVEAAKLTATQINVMDTTGTASKKVIVVYLIGMFGCATAGDVYCQIAQAVDELHNAKLKTPRSRTYIDDGMLIDSPENIQNSTNQYIEHVEGLLGN